MTFCLSRNAIAMAYLQAHYRHAEKVRARELSDNVWWQQTV